MGGVEFEVDGSTASPGLFAAGEDCGGVHGANRLGGNGVANSTVFGGIAGDTMAGYVSKSRTCRDPDESVIDAGIARAEKPFGLPSEDLFDLRERLSDNMWNEIGIMRTAESIASGREKLAEQVEELNRIGVADGDRGFNLTWHDWLNLESLTTISGVIAAAAEARKNSRGAHFREDFPDTGDLETTTYTRVSLDGSDLQVEAVPVEFSLVRPGETLIRDEVGAA
jgi:fumarate reductase flavoprotein subunit